MKTLIALLAAVLAGCTSMQTTNDTLARQWTGQPADNFFVQHGPPAQRHTAQDGRIVYVWTTGGVIVSHPNPPYCEVQLVTDRGGKVLQIGVRAETIGMWNLSACAERFGA